MTTTTVLDDAEQRIPPATATAQEVRQGRIEAMREEVGRKHYDQAKLELPKFEAFLSKEIRPFVDRVSRIGQRAMNPLPHHVQLWLNEMVMLGESVPRTIHTGFDAWAKLAPPIGPDGREVDVNERARLIYHIRFCLRNWDGMQGRLGDLKAYTEHYIRESGWPASQPPAAA
jgi:hypothetical protein